MNNFTTPPNTFIANYMQSLETQETAIDYDFWCALWLLSLAIGRNTVVARPHAPVYLNLYAILVADSGVTRKSSAVRNAVRLATMLQESDPVIGILESKITPEKLDEVLHQRSTVTGSGQLAIAISELAVFLGTEKYNASMPSLLTDLYDAPVSRSGGGSISRGGMEQRNLWISFLSASTPSWLFNSVNPNTVAGGFSSRCLFIVCERAKGRFAWPCVSDTADTTRQQLELLNAIRSQARRQPEITVNDGGLKAFTDWYRRRSTSVDAFRASFESREDAHVLRVAALLCANDDTWIIQSTHVKQAIRLVESVKRSSSKLFEGTGSRTKFVLGFEKLCELLIASGKDAVPRSRAYLTVRNFLSNQEFAALVDVLHELGAIQRFEYKANEGAGRPTELYRGTKELHSKGFAGRLMERLHS